MIGIDRMNEKVLRTPLKNKSTYSPTVSVIMNCLNCAPYLREAIDSVFAQTYQDWEIIFLDNFSTDGSPEIAKIYGEKLKYFKTDQIYPLGKVRNMAIEQSQGNYIAFLDCDDIWLPTKLERQIPIFEANSKIGLVYSNAIYFNEKNKNYQLYKRKKPPSGFVFNEIVKKPFLCISTAIVRKKVFSDLTEWFDERFNAIEDFDLFLRIAHDWEFKYVDIVLTKYRMHEKSWTFTKRYLFFEESKILVNKIRNLYPPKNDPFNYEASLSEGILSDASLSYERALTYWMKGEKQKVRELLKPYLKLNKKILISYLLSYFLSYRHYIYILKILGSRIYIT